MGVEIISSLGLKTLLMSTIAFISSRNKKKVDLIHKSFLIKIVTLLKHRLVFLSIGCFSKQLAQILFSDRSRKGITRMKKLQTTFKIWMNT